MSTFSHLPFSNKQILFHLDARPACEMLCVELRRCSARWCNDDRSSFDGAGAQWSQCDGGGAHVTAVELVRLWWSSAMAVELK